MKSGSLSWKKARSIKAHRTTAKTGPTAGSWQDCDGLAIIEDETLGGFYQLESDGITLTALEEGLADFGGCIHYQNNSGGDKDPLVAGRLLILPSDEAKCSQRAAKLTQKDGDENTLSYNGTVYLNKGDQVKLQYYVSDNSIDFIDNAVFENPVAWTIWLKFSGIK